MSLAPIDTHWVQKPGTRIRGLVRPTTVLEAAQMLGSNPALRPVAGGTDLVLELARSGAGGHVELLDLTHIEGFAELSFDGPEIVLGAGVRHRDILGSDQAVDLLLPLAQACLEVGSPQLRNRATIAGNLVTASPANDTISALLALDATLLIVRADGDDLVERSVRLQDFYTGFRTTDLHADELVTQIAVPQPSPRQKAIWVKAGLRKAQAISVVHAGFVLDFNDDETVKTARIALGSVGPIVALCEPAQSELVGSVLSTEAIERAAAAAVAAVAPIDDGRATAAYRSDTVHTVVSRSLAALAAGSHRDRWPTRVPLLSVAVDAGQARSAISEVSVTVNAERVTHAVVGTGTLLDWLREAVGTGTKEGCAEGECGACTVHLDGDAVMSCLVPAAQADGSQVRTVEGLGVIDDLHPMKQSFVDTFAVQCGYCIPGFIMAAERLAEEFDSPPTRDEVELALSGNLCRCTGYYNIIEAVTTAIADQST